MKQNISGKQALIFKGELTNSLMEYTWPAKEKNKYKYWHVKTPQSNEPFNSPYKQSPSVDKETHVISFKQLLNFDASFLYMNIQKCKVNMTFENKSM